MRPGSDAPGSPVPARYSVLHNRLESAAWSAVMMPLRSG